MSDPNDVLQRYVGIPREGPERAVLRLLIELSVQVVDAEEGSLLVLDRDADPNDLVFAMTIGSDRSERALSGQRVPLGEGITGLAALTHEVQIGAPLFDSLEFAEHGDAPDGQPAAVMAAPMLAGDELVGVLTAVRFGASRRFSGDDAALYARVASVAGVVVDQRQRLDQLEAAAVVAKAEAEDGGPGAGAELVLEREIDATVRRLVRARPDRLSDLAALLRGVERLQRSGDES